MTPEGDSPESPSGSLTHRAGSKSCKYKQRRDIAGNLELESFPYLRISGHALGTGSGED
jgi:hypothetical protein